MEKRIKCIDNSMPTGEEEQFLNAMNSVVAAVGSVEKMNFFDFYYAMISIALSACEDDEMEFAEEAFFECLHKRIDYPKNSETH